MSSDASGIQLRTSKLRVEIAHSTGAVRFLTPDGKSSLASRRTTVAFGCLKGGFGDAVDALTRYRRIACERPRGNREKCPVIFNDYMNCLWGDPTEAKELPLIKAVGAVGREYYVIDAGRYAVANEDWSQTLGAWQPSATRWPPGLKFVMGKIKEAGMTPGLWLEPEVAGVHPCWRRSPIAGSSCATAKDS